MGGKVTVEPLTGRELELLRRQANGEKYRAIAPTMFLSVPGVGSMSNRMIGRLGARSIAHAVHLAHQQGLLEDEPSVVLPVSLVQVLELVADGRTNGDIARTLIAERRHRDHRHGNGYQRRLAQATDQVFCVIDHGSRPKEKWFVLLTNQRGLDLTSPRCGRE
jgi:DNA-binding CsgD family transcriptional regulator